MEKNYFSLKHVLLILIAITFFTSSVNFIFADEKEKPVIEIQFFYDNPCAACPTVSDFQMVVSDTGKSLWDEVTFRILPWNTYTSAGNRELQRVLDEFEITGPDRGHSEYVLIGDTLLTGTNMIENDLGDVLALRAEVLLAERADEVDETDEAGETDEPVTTDDTGNEHETTLDSSADIPMTYQLHQSSETWLYYFYIEPCPSCERANDVFAAIGNTAVVDLPDSGSSEQAVNLIRKDIGESDIQELAISFFDAYQVPENEQIVPIVFMGDYYLSGAEAIENELQDKIEQGDGLYEIELIPLEASDEPSFFVSILPWLAGILILIIVLIFAFQKQKRKKKPVKK